MTNAVLHPSFFCALSRESALGSSIWQSRILAEGLPLAGNGKFPYLILAKAIIGILHSVFFGILSRESPSVRQYGKAVFLPRDSRLRETANSRKQTTCSHFFEILFNAKTTFSCVSGIK